MIARFRASASKGYSLIEVVIALGLSLLTLSVVYSLYVTELKAQSVREDILEMQQQARVVIDLIGREILMAGFDPRGVNKDPDPTNDFLGLTYVPDQLWIKADLNGNGTIRDRNESIVYVFDSVTNTLRRNTGGGNQPFGENIESLLVQYWDQHGTPTKDTLSIRQVGLTVTARTAHPDPKILHNGGYRTMTLHARLTPRNL